MRGDTRSQPNTNTARKPDSKKNAQMPAAAGGGAWRGRVNDRAGGGEGNGSGADSGDGSITFPVAVPKECSGSPVTSTRPSSMLPLLRRAAIEYKDKKYDELTAKVSDQNEG